MASPKIKNQLVDAAWYVVNDTERRLFHALFINYCNGGINEDHAEKPWSFCDPVVGYGLRIPVPLCLWYKYLIEGICAKQSRPDFKKTQNAMMEMISLMRNQHQKCMRQLLNEENLSEEKIKCILAIHYFQPLSKQGTNCYVDKCQGFKKCLMCEKEVKADHKKTSFGNSLVWHGQADILIESKNIVSMVKVSQEENISEEEIEASFSDDDHEIVDCSKIVEVKTEETKCKARSHSQAIAQTIVNAFVESNRDRSLFDKFIPSFLATNKYIRIILYNCNLDKLLFSEELPIWNDDDDNLNISTMIFLWVELNNLRHVKDDVEEFLESIIPECRFKDAVGDAYEIYLKKVSRPCNKEMKLDSHKENFVKLIRKGEMKKIRDTYFSLQKIVNEATQENQD